MLLVIGLIGSLVFMVLIGIVSTFIRCNNYELQAIIKRIFIIGELLICSLLLVSSFASMALYNNYHDKTETYLLKEIQLEPVEDNFYICTDVINDKQIIERRTANSYYYCSYYKGSKLYTEKIEYNYCQIKEVPKTKPCLKIYKYRVPLSKQNSLIFKLLYFNKNNVEREDTTYYVFCVPNKKNSVLLNYSPKQDLVETTERRFK